jgi:raffinose/stachyose/melibiose transport system permease protein
MEAEPDVGTRKDNIFNVVAWVILVVAIIISIYPLIWMFLGSFKTNDQMFSNPLGLPTSMDFSVFKVAWQRANFTTALVNSLLNVIGTNIIVIIASSCAAFALSRIKFPGRNLITFILSSSIVISGQIILIPLFFTLRDLHIYNTLWATIVADAAMDLPICIILTTTFFKSIPFEIEESTVIDGCSRWGFFTRFIIPLSKPIMATIIIFVSLWTWNEYLFALTFLKDTTVRTIPLQLQNFQGRWATEYGLIFAALSLFIVPLIILYLFMQKSFIKGLTAGAVKE